MYGDHPQVIVHVSLRTAGETVQAIGTLLYQLSSNTKRYAPVSRNFSWGRLLRCGGKTVVFRMRTYESTYYM